MKKWIILFIFTIILSACGDVNLTPTPVDDGLTHYFWVGDDLIQTGTLDMQVLLLLELSGYTQMLHTGRSISPRNTLSSPLNTQEFLDHTILENEDYIFLQAFGIQRDFKESEYKKNSQAWIDYFRSQNKDVIVFYPWFSAVDTASEMKRLDKLVLELVWKNNLTMVPVGPAWEAALAERPDINLYASDGIHPSAQGLYLTSCVFYFTITGESPQGNPVYTSIGNDHPDQIVKLDGETIEFLQRVAWETINEYVKNDEFRVIIKK